MIPAAVGHLTNGPLSLGFGNDRSEGGMDTLLVQQITEQVRSRIQEGLDQNLGLRKSRFW